MKRILVTGALIVLIGAIVFFRLIPAVHSYIDDKNQAKHNLEFLNYAASHPDLLETVITTPVIGSSSLHVVDSEGKKDGMTKSTPYGDSRDVILAKVNEQRLMVGFSVLHRNTQLDQAAAAKLLDMRQRGYFDHEYDGTYFFEFIDKSGYPRYWSGENLARGYKTPEGVIAAWIASKYHYTNILSTYYTDTGIATDGDYYVEMFASKK